MPVAGDCDDCRKVEIEGRLDAEESERAFSRELEKLDREHANALDAAEDSAATALEKAQWDAEVALTKLFHEKVSELATGAVERSRDSAKYVQTAAAWIATLYGAILALVFSVGDNPLPLRGVYAAAFLGLAVALATAYLAFITNGGRVKLYGGGGSLAEQQLNRTAFFIDWVNRTVRDRRWAIRASVICLALGVAFIPAPFVANSNPKPIPEAPAAPAIPGTIAAQVGDTAAALFKAQIDGYEKALEARNAAIANESSEAEGIADDEARTNRIALALALAGLALALIGPLVYGHFADDDDEETDAAQ